MDRLVNPAKQERGRETQDRILQACKKLLKKEAFESISIRRIIQEADTSIGSFYARFRDKSALLPVLYSEYEERLEAKLENLKVEMAGACSLDEVASLIVAYFVNLCGENPNLNRALYEYATRDPKSVEVKKMAKRRLNQHAFMDEALLSFRSEIPHPDPERAVQLGIYFMVVTCRNRLFYPLAPQTNMLKISTAELKTELVNLLTGYLRHCSTSTAN